MNCLCNDVVFVSQLYNHEGLMLTYTEFLSKYNIPVTPEDCCGYCMLFPLD